MSIRGIDVSDYQPDVDWKAVANAGVSFAFIKATEGTSFICGVFSDYWKQTKEQGLLRGAYHFFRPDSDVLQQAYHFLKVVKLEDGDLPPVLDIETMGQLDAERVCDRAAEWLDIVERETGYRPIIYTYPGFWQKLGTQRFSDYPLWIAHYTQAEQPMIPGAWKTWVFWQYTDRGTVEGVKGGVDVNLFESLAKGTSGDKVEKLQNLLKFRGFDPGPIDGIFGKGTESALMEYQKQKGLQADGIAALRTWTSLLGKAEAAVVPGTPEPTPEPTPTPTPVPEPEPAIDLIVVCKAYQGISHQDQALVWLQQQIPQTALLEFTKGWRNQTQTPTKPVQLIDVCKYYRGLSNQDESLRVLQQKITATTLIEFANKWNQPASATVSIKLADVCKYYKGLPNQLKALEWLQGQIPATVLAEFSRQWRK